jgi:hypothetical protein
MNVLINGIDISSDVNTNSFTYIDRADNIYGTGSLQFESKTINYNIPPYSILEVDGIKYCCSSEASYHYGRKSWFHNVSIIELTSLLSRFLVGSKAFSVTGTNIYDHDKIRILLTLMSNKYNVNINAHPYYEEIFEKKIEYVFGAGTTLFDALNEIAMQYNYKVIVTNADETTIDIDFKNLNGREYKLDTTRLLSIQKIQNSETYCNNLEIEARNVIDRTTKTLINNLVVKSPNVKLSEDTAILELPTKVEEITDFGLTNVKSRASINLQFNESKFPFGTFGLITYQEATKYYPELNSLYDTYFSEFFVNKEWFYSTIWKCQSNTMTPQQSGEYEGQLSNAYLKYPMNNNILPKEKWDLLEDNDKPNFAYYTTNSNIIEGFNTYYKTDLWNQIIGETVQSFIKKMPVPRTTKYDGLSFGWGSFVAFEVFGEQPESFYQNIFNLNWYVEYIAITNPLLKDTKVKTPTNETRFKNYSLSYNNSSSFVDFDKIVNSMSIENKSMGCEELVIEYDATNIDNIPNVTNTINLENNTWYVSNSQITIHNNQRILTMNLVNDFNKLADCIALNSQYNTLQNPSDNIIERPLLFEYYSTAELKKGDCYFRIKFWLDNYEERVYYIPAVLMQKNNIVYAYCEMQDYYSVGKYAQYVSEGVYKMVDASYVDENNESLMVTVGLGTFTNKLTNEQVMQLPNYDGTFNVDVSVGTISIFKDAREKLTFTIKLNNCIIK